MESTVWYITGLNRVITDRNPPVSFISWLENDLFLIGYTSGSTEMGEPTDSYLISRQKGTSSFSFQRTAEICGPFGINRSPAQHFIQRLRNFPPSLDDVLILASTSGNETGVLVKSKEPLSSGADASEITNVFVSTIITDSKRAQMPLQEDMQEDTSAIGMALDLSSREKVKRPLPGEEMDESAGPLPALMILNNEGILCAWWFVYADSIRQGTTYSDLLDSQSQDQAPPKPITADRAAPSTSFGQPGFPSAISNVEVASPFGKPALATASPFGAASQPTSGGLFGSAATTNDTKPAFGTVTSQNPPLSTAGPATGSNTAFGSPSTIGGSKQGAAFGMSGGLGNKGSVWGSSPGAKLAKSGNAFGQPSGMGMGTASPFSSSGTPFSNSSKPAGGAFSSFASGAGFLGSAAQSGGSVFKQSSTDGAFGNAGENNTFSGLEEKPKDSSAGTISSGGFKLGSTFTSDGTAKDDLPKPKVNMGDSFFGGSLNESLDQAGNVEELNSDDEMAGESDIAPGEASEDEPPKSPATPPATEQPKPFPTNTPLKGGMFGTQSQGQTTLAAVQSSTPAKPPPESTTPEDTPQKQEQTPSASPSVSDEGSSLTPVRDEAEDETSQTPRSKIDQTPLPPESTSKTSYAAGESSISSKASSDDAPLPPDFLPSKSKLSKAMGPPEQPPLPNDNDDEGLDDEGSGVDVAQDLSPTEPTHTPGITPGSSFTGSIERTPLGEKFVNVRRQEPRPKASALFGELTESTTPSLPPPTKPRTILSPRSPSPVRQELLQKSLLSKENIRPANNQRSISSPARPAEMFAPRRPQRLPKPPPQEPEEEEEEEAEVSDEEDEKVQRRLNSEIIPTKHLPDLEVHKDYVGKITKPGIPGQIERVERDITSMIDVLGLNAHSLKSWILAQEARTTREDATFEDLESLNPNEATLDDLDSLSSILESLSAELRDNRIQLPQAIFQFIQSTSQSLSLCFDQRPSLQRAIDSHSDPQQISSRRSAPLPQDKALLLRDLRSRVTAYQSRLAQAESEIVNLRTQLATSKGVSPAKGKRPTVEAVMKTIEKMTAMVEKRSGDVDVLEYQLRKIGIRPKDAVFPPTNSNEAGHDRDREGTPTAGLQQGLQSMNLGTASDRRRKPRRTTFSEEEIEEYRLKMRRRKEMFGVIQEVLVKNGPRMTGLDE